MSEIRYNYDTGKAIRLETNPDGNDNWVETPTRSNENGVVIAFDGEDWKTAYNPSEEMGLGKKALRSAEFGARGFTDSVSETLGAIPDMVASGFRKIGLPSPEEGYYTDAIKSGVKSAGEFISTPLNAVTDFGPPKPISEVERGAFGAGRGVGDVASFMAPALAVSKAAKGGTTLSNVANAIKSQPLMQAAAGGTGGAVTETTGNPWLGLAASIGLPIGTTLSAPAFKKAITPFTSQLGINEQNLAKIAEKMGIKLTPGQLTGSPGLQTMESSFTQLPFTSAKQKSLYDTQRAKFNNAALKTAGVNADNVRPETLSKAFDDIGDEFDNLARNTRVDITPQTTNEAQKIVSEADRFLSPDLMKPLNAFKDDLNELHKKLLGDPSLAGREYQALASRMRTFSRKSTDPNQKEALGKFINLLDDTMQNSAGPELAKQWATVRSNYRNLLMINEAVTTGQQAARVMGDIPFAGLTSATRKADRFGFGRGRGDLRQVSRVGEFLANAIPPDTGTARRNLTNNLMTLGLGGGGGGAVASGGDLGLSIASILAAIGAPKALQSAYNLKPVQAYFRNQALPKGKGKLSKDLLAKQELLSKILLSQEAGNNIEGLN